MRGFGHATLFSKEDPLLDLLAKKLGRLSSVGSQIIMSYLYDMNYGLHDHGEVIQPLSQVLMHEKEIYGPNTPHTKSARDYRRYKISEYGLSLFEWLELPVEDANNLIELAKEYMQTEAKIADNAKNSLDALVRKG